jgi:microcystin-dependent protein
MGNKKIGNQVGPVALPNGGTANGAYTSDEVYRFLVLDSFPRPLESLNSSVGDYALAASSGVADVACASNNFLQAYGSSVDKSNYPELFNVIGEHFGGDLSQFTLPDVSRFHSYLKATTGPSGVASSGILPTHTHGVAGDSTTGYQYPFVNGGGSTPRLSQGPVNTKDVGYTGGSDNNGKSKEIVPLICSTNSEAYIGFAVQFFVPTDVTIAAAVLPISTIIASGQAISRTGYATLFDRIGTLYGSGDGSTTFNIPDYRGVFLHGTQAGINQEVDPYITGSGYQPDSFRIHNHNVVYTTGGPNSPGNTSPSNGGFLTTPATTASNIGGNESRPPNYLCLNVIVVSGAL